MKINYFFKVAIAGCGILVFQNLNAQNLQNGLVAHFTLNGNGDDVSTLNIDGTLVGTTPTTGYQSQPNTALHFNFGDKMTCGTDNRTIATTFSISTWIRTTSTETTHIVSKYDWMVDRGFYIGTYNNKMILAGRNGSGQFVYAGLGITSVNDGNWHHVLATCDGATWKLYVDCNLETTITSISSNPNLATSIPLTIGYYYSGENGDYRYFEGDIDEVRIYNRVLTNSEEDLLCDVRLNVEENTTKEGLKISYLTNNRYEIKWDNTEEYVVSWFDVTGKEKGSRIDHGIIDLSEESAGMYFLKVSTRSGKLISQTKLIKM